MLGSGVTGPTRQHLKRVWSSRLAAPLRPASSGPVRYWQDQVRLAVKGAIAAVGAWALARYAVGQPDPYFAPLAALLGVYPTVARSLREGVQYVAGFLLGAALAIPAGMLLGPGIAGIAVVVIAGVLVSGWHRLGDQSPQVTFTALFALLLGGYQPVHYITHRMVEVGIGVATGLAVNVLVFPPLQLRPAAHAIRQWGNDIARALEDLTRYQGRRRARPGPGVIRQGLRRAPAEPRRSRPPARRPANFPALRCADRRLRLPAPPRAGNSSPARSQRCAQRRATPHPAHQRTHPRGRGTPSRPRRPGGPLRQVPRNRTWQLTTLRRPLRRPFIYPHADHPSPGNAAART